MNPKCTMSLYKILDVVSDNLSLPDGISIEYFIDTLGLKYGKYYLISSDLDYLKIGVKAWCRRHEKTFIEWKRIFDLEYEPIQNYDRYDSEIITNNISGKSTNDVEIKTNTYEDDAYHNATKQDGDNTESRNENGTRTLRSYGNIGVTTSQQMAESHLSLYGKYELYDMMADLFRDDFLYIVY